MHGSHVISMNQNRERERRQDRRHAFGHNQRHQIMFPIQVNGHTHHTIIDIIITIIIVNATAVASIASTSNPHQFVLSCSNSRERLIKRNGSVSL